MSVAFSDKKTKSRNISYNKRLFIHPQKLGYNQSHYVKRAEF